MRKLVVVVVLLVAAACKREPDPTAATPTAGSVASAPRDAATPRAPHDAGPAAANVRMPIAAAKLEMVGNATIKALELADNGDVRVGDKLYGTLGPDGTFTRDGKVLAALGEGGELQVDGKPADPPIRIDPNGDVFVGGELMMTIDDDGKINTVGKDGAITENVLALLEGPPQGRRAVALLLVLISTTSNRSSPPPEPTSREK
jgi:hypothetical protein